MSLDQLVFDNQFTSQLPGDEIAENYLREVRGACYSVVQPSKATDPKLVAVSQDCAEMVGLSTKDCESPSFLQVFAGNQLLSPMQPFAMCYGGHQFGNWAGQLGDGRAITLGEVRHKNQLFSLQLKGAGTTPYSRSADGLAVLRSSLREYVCSEAMHFLGIPTTRALSLIMTGDPVLRDMLYDGNPKLEPGAVVCRVAPSFIRFGNFEILAARQEIDLLKQLADYTIDSSFPEIAEISGRDRYLLWFAEVLKRTVTMVTKWMQVGFVHGVMNTDNMSILGLTIDYGPYGWLEGFDPSWTPNTTDAMTKRYTYGRQPSIAQWNLLQLANAIVPLVEETKPLEEILNDYGRQYGDLWGEALLQKLGLDGSEKVDQEFLLEMEKVLQLTETDMTLFFRHLSDLQVDDLVRDSDPVSKLAAAYYDLEHVKPDDRERINAWLKRYGSLSKKISRSGNDRKTAMDAVNPLYVPRNYLAQIAIDRVEEGDYTYLMDWMEVLKSPYTKQPGKEAYAGRRPEWARTRVGCSMLSCSS